MKGNRFAVAVLKGTLPSSCVIRRRHLLLAEAAAFASTYRRLNPGETAMILVPPIGRSLRRLRVKRQGNDEPNEVSR